MILQKLCKIYKILQPLVALEPSVLKTYLCIKFKNDPCEKYSGQNIFLCSCFGGPGVERCFSIDFTIAIRKNLRANEDSLERLFAYFLNTDSLTEERMIADSIFTRTLVRALKIKNSFYYPFDSFLGISKIYAPIRASGYLPGTFHTTIIIPGKKAQFKCGQPMVP